MCSNLSAYNLTLEEQDKFDGQLSIKQDKLRVLAKEELGAWTDTFSAKACLVENNDICKVGQVTQLKVHESPPDYSVV